MDSQPSTCWHCGQPSVGCCPECQFAEYCSEDCLVADRETHQRECDEAGSAELPCANCGRQSRHLSPCPRCHLAAYCSGSCRELHSRLHLPACLAGRDAVLHVANRLTHGQAPSRLPVCFGDGVHALDLLKGADMSGEEPCHVLQLSATVHHLLRTAAGAADSQRPLMATLASDSPHQAARAYLLLYLLARDAGPAAVVQILYSLRLEPGPARQLQAALEQLVTATYSQLLQLLPWVKFCRAALSHWQEVWRGWLHAMQDRDCLARMERCRDAALAEAPARQRLERYLAALPDRQRRPVRDLLLRHGTLLEERQRRAAAATANVTLLALSPHREANRASFGDLRLGAEPPGWLQAAAGAATVFCPPPSPAGPLADWDRAEVERALGELCDPLAGCRRVAEDCAAAAEARAAAGRLAVRLVQFGSLEELDEQLAEMRFERVFTADAADRLGMFSVLEMSEVLLAPAPGALIVSSHARWAELSPPAGAAMSALRGAGTMAWDRRMDSERFRMQAYLQAERLAYAARAREKDVLDPHLTVPVVTETTTFGTLLLTDFTQELHTAVPHRFRAARRLTSAGDDAMRFLEWRRDPDGVRRRLIEARAIEQKDQEGMTKRVETPQPPAHRGPGRYERHLQSPVGEPISEKDSPAYGSIRRLPRVGSERAVRSSAPPVVSSSFAPRPAPRTSYWGYGTPPIYENVSDVDKYRAQSRTQSVRLPQRRSTPSPLGRSGSLPPRSRHQSRGYTPAHAEPIYGNLSSEPEFPSLRDVAQDPRQGQYITVRPLQRQTDRRRTIELGRVRAQTPDEPFRRTESLRLPRSASAQGQRRATWLDNASPRSSSGGERLLITQSATPPNVLARHSGLYSNRQPRSIDSRAPLPLPRTVRSPTEDAVYDVPWTPMTPRSDLSLHSTIPGSGSNALRPLSHNSPYDTTPTYERPHSSSHWSPTVGSASASPMYDTPLPASHYEALQTPEGRRRLVDRFIFPPNRQERESSASSTLQRQARPLGRAASEQPTLKRPAEPTLLIKSSPQPGPDIPSKLEHGAHQTDGSREDSSMAVGSTTLQPLSATGGAASPAVSSPRDIERLTQHREPKRIADWLREDRDRQNEFERRVVSPDRPNERWAREELKPILTPPPTRPGRVSPAVEMGARQAAAVDRRRAFFLGRHTTEQRLARSLEDEETVLPQKRQNVKAVASEPQTISELGMRGQAAEWVWQQCLEEVIQEEKERLRPEMVALLERQVAKALEKVSGMSSVQAETSLEDRATDSTPTGFDIAENQPKTVERIPTPKPPEINTPEPKPDSRSLFDVNAEEVGKLASPRFPDVDTPAPKEISQDTLFGEFSQPATGGEHVVTLKMSTNGGQLTTDNSMLYSSSVILPSPERTIPLPQLIVIDKADEPTSIQPPAIKAPHPIAEEKRGSQSHRDPKSPLPPIPSSFDSKNHGASEKTGDQTESSMLLTKTFSDSPNRSLDLQEHADYDVPRSLRSSHTAVGADAPQEHQAESVRPDLTRRRAQLMQRAATTPISSPTSLNRRNSDTTRSNPKQEPGTRDDKTGHGIAKNLSTPGTNHKEDNSSRQDDRLNGEPATLVKHEDEFGISDGKRPSESIPSIDGLNKLEQDKSNGISKEQPPAVILRKKNAAGTRETDGSPTTFRSSMLVPIDSESQKGPVKELLLKFPLVETNGTTGHHSTSLSLNAQDMGNRDAGALADDIVNLSLTSGAQNKTERAAKEAVTLRHMPGDAKHQQRHGHLIERRRSRKLSMDKEYHEMKNKLKGAEGSTTDVVPKEPSDGVTVPADIKSDEKRKSRPLSMDAEYFAMKNKLKEHSGLEGHKTEDASSNIRHQQEIQPSTKVTEERSSLPTTGQTDSSLKDSKSLVLDKSFAPQTPPSQNQQPIAIEKFHTERPQPDHVEDHSEPISSPRNMALSGRPGSIRLRAAQFEQAQNAANRVGPEQRSPAADLSRTGRKGSIRQRVEQMEQFQRQHSSPTTLKKAGSPTKVTTPTSPKPGSPFTSMGSGGMAIKVTLRNPKPSPPRIKRRSIPAQTGSQTSPRTPVTRAVRSPGTISEPETVASQQASGTHKTPQAFDDQQGSQHEPQIPIPEPRRNSHVTSTSKPSEERLLSAGKQDLESPRGSQNSQSPPVPDIVAQTTNSPPSTYNIQTNISAQEADATPQPSPKEAGYESIAGHQAPVSSTGADTSNSSSATEVEQKPRALPSSQSDELDDDVFADAANASGSPGPLVTSL